MTAHTLLACVFCSMTDQQRAQRRVSVRKAHRSICVLEKIHNRTLSRYKLQHDAQSSSAGKDHRTFTSQRHASVRTLLCKLLI